MQGYSSNVDRVEAEQNQIEAKQKELAEINKKLKNKKLSRANRAKLLASKKKINEVIRKTKHALALEPKKITLNISADHGTLSKIKAAPSQTVATSETGVSADAMERLFFDSIGATEIINIARHDNINTVNPQYVPIQDMMGVNIEYDPNKIVAMQKTSLNYFNNFAIDLDSYIPVVGTGPNGANVYIDTSNGSLVINVKDLPKNFSIEVQTMSFDGLFDDTIYT